MVERASLKFQSIVHLRQNGDAANSRNHNGQWLQETTDTHSLLLQLGAMVNSRAPVWEPAP